MVRLFGSTQGIDSWRERVSTKVFVNLMMITKRTDYANLLHTTQKARAAQIFERKVKKQEHPKYYTFDVSLLRSHAIHFIPSILESQLEPNTSPIASGMISCRR